MFLIAFLIFKVSFSGIFKEKFLVKKFCIIEEAFKNSYYCFRVYLNHIEIFLSSFCLVFRFALQSIFFWWYPSLGMFLKDVLKIISIYTRDQAEWRFKIIAWMVLENELSNLNWQQFLTSTCKLSLRNELYKTKNYKNHVFFKKNKILQIIQKW